MQCSVQPICPLPSGALGVPWLSVVQCSVFLSYYTVYFSTHSNTRLHCPYILASQCQVFYSVIVHPVNSKMDCSVSHCLQPVLGLPWGGEECFLRKRKLSISKKSVKVQGFALQWINSDRTQCYTLQLHWDQLLGI